MFFKRSALVFVAVVLMVASATSGILAASWYGSTGLFRIPTADVLHEEALRVGAYGFGMTHTASIGYGVYPDVEIALVGFYRPNQARLTGAVKGRIFTETVDRPAVAVGFVDDSFYGVMSKQIAPRLRAHAGLGSKQGVFAGLSYLVNPVVVTRPGEFTMPRMTLLAEYDHGEFNVGTQFTFTDHLDAYVTWVDFDRLAIGASWQF